MQMQYGPHWPKRINNLGGREGKQGSAKIVNRQVHPPLQQTFMVCKDLQCDLPGIQDINLKLAPESLLRLPCTLKMVNLRFLFFSIKINVSLESFYSEKEIWKKSKYSPRKWDHRFPPEVKVYFWLTAYWCECSHPERFSRERLFMGEPPYLLFPEAFCVRLCYIFVVRARLSKLWLCYGNPQAAEMSVG